jgi:CRISPR/Cas system type I-B associated protein Csh2 (Cas7 group RAMP superfamily)
MKNLAVHTAIKDFIATGMTEQQAEKIVTDIITIAKDEVSSSVKDQSDLVTKNDLKVALSDFKSELKKEFATKDDLKIAIGGLERDMKWLMGIGVAILVAVGKIAFFQ